MSCKCSMEHINDDMDELFRRAAEGYPLNTDSADWNAVIKKLVDTSLPNSEKPVTKNKNYKHLFWLLLLLPLVWLYNNIGKSDNQHSLGEISKNITNDIKPHSSQHEIVKVKSQLVQPVDIVPNNFAALINPSREPNKFLRKANSIITKTGSASTITDKVIVSAIDPENAISKQKKSVYVSQSGDNKNVEERNERKHETTSNILISDRYMDKIDSLQFDTLKDNQNEKIKTAQKTNRKQINHGLYVGIVISPDLSTIKFQAIKDMGLSKGFLVGYRLNKNISIESGIGWDKKNYYSEGKYFDIKNIRIPYNAKIITVQGVCKMIEIPFTVRYDMGNTNFTTSAGLSGYFMKNETYDYVIERNGQQYPRRATYNNSSNNLFAVSHISIGYKRTIKKSITLRLEPYLKIPLKGVGIGNLPIMSTGLNIGITKKLF